MTALEQRILDVLRGAQTALDHEGIWLGYCDDYEPDAVRRAIRNLKRRGEVTAVTRGFYEAVELTPEGGSHGA